MSGSRAIKERLAAGLHVRRPAACLAPYVSQVWLGLDNRQDHYDIVPDGCIDVVLHVDGRRASLAAYGSTTRLHREAIGPGHYLGIRFRPGMARHFLEVPAPELTDRREAVGRECFLETGSLVDSIEHEAVFACVEAQLRRRVADVAPAMSRVDAAVREIDAVGTARSIESLARAYGRGRRQFERDFQRDVGIAPKQYAVISRFHRAANALPHCRPGGLAAVAADLGYADQSHMVRDFQRLAGTTPSAWRKRDAILQDR